MSYNALLSMQAKNKADYGIGDSVCIPDIPEAARSFGCEALAFVREDCANLKFDTSDPNRIALEDSDGRSAIPGSIPFNMERDLDRLGF